MKKLLNFMLFGMLVLLLCNYSVCSDKKMLLRGVNLNICVSVPNSVKTNKDLYTCVFNCVNDERPGEISSLSHIRLILKGKAIPKDDALPEDSLWRAECVHLLIDRWHDRKNWLAGIYLLRKKSSAASSSGSVGCGALASAALESAAPKIEPTFLPWLIRNKMHEIPVSRSPFIDMVRKTCGSQRRPIKT